MRLLAAALLLCACHPITDVELAPPTAGFQLAPAPFEVPMTAETQRCYFITVPSDTPVYVNAFEIAQNAGTHHMNIFRVRTIRALSGMNGDVVAEGECWKSGNWADWPLVVNSQASGSIDQTVPGHTRFQMPPTTAMRFEPHELLMLQTHYVNASTQKTPLRGKVLVNFETVEASTVTAEVGTAFATNQNIRVCPGDQGKFFSATCAISQTTPVTIIGANSHFHSRGTDFTISLFDPAAAGTPPAFYESKNWNDPPMEWSLNIPVPAGGGFRYRCEYDVPSTTCGNPDDSCCFTFGGKVETQEHCNAFVYYFPKTHDVGCF
jgi:hypothetical protein